jgi:LytS/YehU family sensor histidine kinase
LNSIYGLVLTTPRAAADMVLRLSDFCRATLTRSEGDTLTMRECFERISLYLGIEKVRWKESLHIEMQLDDRVHDLRLPPFLLQPLVENAVKYGGSTSAEELYIRLAAWLEPVAGENAVGWLVIEVANSGEWIEPAVAKAQGNTGLGHINLRQRLERTFPGKYEFETKSAGGWVTVRIRLRVTVPETLPANVVNPS